MQKYEGVGAILGNCGREVVTCVYVVLRERGVHSVEFVVEFGEIRVGIPWW